MYGSWDIKHKRQDFCYFGLFFALLLPNNQQNQSFEKLKKLPEILSFYTVVPWMKFIWCMIPEICYVTDRIFSDFGPFFALLPHPLTPPISPRNKNIKKNLKNTFLHKWTKNHDHRVLCSWDMAHDRCNCHFSLWAIFFLLATKQPEKWKIYLEIS